ncbi:hypothetical protein HELRODRAFT_177645 [Helobdella robusta]|uniref:Uncharacterized protein n=1 Tax=Helobdella robusta TaxID=6412 RepID=T1FC01_HELRO|nr:hypothetical protein HELRODRAFT_177645 [Helobdella robusta]ESN97974.1 hypothetical protein HELRODRAFT_177645 [Helobdella robusta]
MQYGECPGGDKITKEILTFFAKNSYENKIIISTLEQLNLYSHNSSNFTYENFFIAVVANHEDEDESNRSINIEDDEEDDHTVTINGHSYNLTQLDDCNAQHFQVYINGVYITYFEVKDDVSSDDELKDFNCILKIKREDDLKKTVTKLLEKALRRQ